MKTELKKTTRLKTTLGWNTNLHQVPKQSESKQFGVIHTKHTFAEKLTLMLTQSNAICICHDKLLF